MLKKLNYSTVGPQPVHFSFDPIWINMTKTSFLSTLFNSLMKHWLRDSIYIIQRIQVQNVC